jgi:hypothetical protein
LTLRAKVAQRASSLNKSPALKCCELLQIFNQQAEVLSPASHTPLESWNTADVGCRHQAVAEVGLSTAQQGKGGMYAEIAKT